MDVSASQTQCQNSNNQSYSYKIIALYYMAQYCMSSWSTPVPLKHMQVIAFALHSITQKQTGVVQ